MTAPTADARRGLRSGLLQAHPLVLMVLILLLSQPQRGVYAHRRLLQALEPSAPEGWWQALVVDGNFCQLASYPPRAATGTSRISCKSKKYDHNFLWRLTQPKSNLSQSGDLIKPNASMHLRSFNLIATYTNINPSTRDVLAGISASKAVQFTVQPYSGDSGKGSGEGGLLSLQRDAVRLAPKSGGYCTRDAGNSASLLNCKPDEAASKAAKVTLPYSSYWGVQLVNQLTQAPCSAQQPTDANAPGQVVCSTLSAAQQSQATRWFSTLGFGLQEPGSPVLLSGSTSLAIKAYDPVLHYDVWTWVVAGSAPFNVTFQTGTQSNAQWLDLAKLSALPGEEKVLPGDIITLRSQATQQYCGVWGTAQPHLVCDQLSVGLMDTGYQFKLQGDWA